MASMIAGTPANSYEPYMDIHRKNNGMARHDRICPVFITHHSLHRQMKQLQDHDPALRNECRRDILGIALSIRFRCCNILLPGSM